MKKDCAGLDIWGGGFSFRTSVAKLRAEQQNCRLCMIFFQCVEKHGKSNQTHVEFFRVGSTFSFSRYGEPVLSIVGHLGMTHRPPTHSGEAIKC